MISRHDWLNRPQLHDENTYLLPFPVQSFLSLVWLLLSCMSRSVLLLTKCVKDTIIMWRSLLFTAWQSKCVTSYIFGIFVSLANRNTYSYRYHNKLAALIFQYSLLKEKLGRKIMLQYRNVLIMFITASKILILWKITRRGEAGTV